MKEDDFNNKHLVRKAKIRYFIRAYRKNRDDSLNSPDDPRMIQIYYMQSYCELVESLHELLFHHNGIMKLRGLLSKLYESLNEVLYKSLSEADIVLLRRIVRINLSDTRILTSRADVFTNQAMQKSIDLSNQLLDYSSGNEKIIHIIRS